MWVPLHESGYLIKYRMENDSFLFFLTDIKKIWSCTFRQERLLINFKEANKALQWPDDTKAVNCIVDLFCKDSVAIKRKVIPSDENLSVLASSTISGYAYKMALLFFLQTSVDVFYEEFTYYLLALAKSFHKREERLLQIIKSKDVELEEYHQEGYEIKRRGVVTAQFNIEAFNKDTLEKASENNLENPASIFTGPIHVMLSQLPKPCVPKESVDETLPAEVSVTVEKHEELSNNTISELSQSVEAKSEIAVPKKKKKTFQPLPL